MIIELVITNCKNATHGICPRVVCLSYLPDRYSILSVVDENLEENVRFLAWQ